MDYSEKIKFTAARLHLKEAARILSIYNKDISETLIGVADWIKDEFKLDQNETNQMQSIIEDLKNG